jgi:DNA-binding transcriptional regulator YiaG
VTGADLSAQLKRMKLTQTAGANLLGVADRTMRNWIADRRTVPLWVERFLDVIEVVPGARERVLWRLEG